MTGSFIALSLSLRTIYSLWLNFEIASLHCTVKHTCLFSLLNCMKKYMIILCCSDMFQTFVVVFNTTWLLFMVFLRSGFWENIKNISLEGPEWGELWTGICLFFAEKIGFHVLGLGFISKKQQKMGMGLRFEQSRTEHDEICALGQWDLVMIWPGKSGPPRFRTLLLTVYNVG
jgi:hypothetical protein